MKPWLDLEMILEEEGGEIVSFKWMNLRKLNLLLPKLKVHLGGGEDSLDNPEVI